VPGADVSGTVGKRGDFEITINDRPVFSKHSAGNFPIFKDVVAAVVKADKGGTATEFDIKPQSSSCVIL
jgi:hypothetical protein